MERRTFLQLIGLTATPLLPLVGSDLGAALTDTEAEKDSAIVRVITSLGVHHFKIPVRFENNPDGGMTCHPIKKSFAMVVGKEGMLIKKMETRMHPELTAFYKSIGLERGWLNVPIPSTFVPELSTVTFELSSNGLYSIN